MAEVSDLPLLHKYVIRPQDDLQLVLNKLNYRLCVKQVSQVIHRRSLGASISEAVDICELKTLCAPAIATNFIMSKTAEMMSHHAPPHPGKAMKPLVFSEEDTNGIASPKMLSPGSDHYCGTMKSDDSGIVMDDTNNFSMTSEDHDEHDVTVFTSAEVSPLEEENHFIQSAKSDVRSSPEAVQEEVQAVVTQRDRTHDQQLQEFFQQAEEDVLEETENSTEIEESQETSKESAQTEPNHALSEEQQNQEENQEQKSNVEPELISSHHLPEEDQSKALPDSQSHEEVEPQSTNQQVEHKQEPEADEDLIVEELIEKQVVEEKEQTLPELEAAEIPEPEADDRVDFVREEEECVELEPGIRCDDAYQALNILKTKYRLSDTSAVKKFVITFSSWNVNQISHPMARNNRCSWWDDSAIEPDPEDDPHVDELMEKIYSRQGEISDLVDRIMEEQAAKIRAEQDALKPASKPRDENMMPSKEELHNALENIMVCDQPALDTVDAQPDTQRAPEESDILADKKKKRNALHRFVHAMRKRMRRNRPPSHTHTDTRVAA